MPTILLPLKRAMKSTIVQTLMIGKVGTRVDFFRMVYSIVHYPTTGW